MAVEVKLPQRGMGMTEATIIRWYKREGERIEAGEILVEFESAKATEELESPASGVISKILFEEEDEVEVGEVLAVIAEGEEEGERERSKEGAPAAATTVAGEAIQQSRMPLSRVRRVTAERMLASLQSTAQLTLFSEIDVSATVEKRTALKERMEVTYTDILVKVVAAALKTHPTLNAVWDGDAITLKPDVNIGVAVALEDGLVVPVLRGADRKSLEEIHAGLTTLVERAHSGRLSLEDLSEGTFTITNLGTYRIDHFTPILNPPETGILGVGRIVQKAVVKEDQIVARWVLGLSLTFDHRVTDGAPAAAFLDEVSLALEEGRF